MPKEDSQFKPGQSGNPSGKPKGTVSPRTEIRKQLRANPSDLTAMVQAQVEKAKAGDSVAFKLVIEWIESALPKTVALSELTNEQILGLLGVDEPEEAP